MNWSVDFQSGVIRTTLHPWSNALPNGILELIVPDVNAALTGLT